MAALEEYYLLYSQGDVYSYLGPLMISMEEASELQNEMNIYLEHAKKLLIGEAPYQCYETNEIKDDLYLNKSRQSIMFFFYLSDSFRESFRKTTASISVDSLLHLLSTPYNPDKEISLGYGVLPILKKVLMRL